MSHIKLHTMVAQSRHRIELGVHIHDADGNRPAKYDYDPVADTKTLLSASDGWRLWADVRQVKNSESNGLFEARSQL